MTQGTDEQELLTRLRGGQDEAFGELFEQHAPAVRRLARSLANDASEAEDITAETFFRVLRAIKRGNGPHDNVRGYLLTVARRVAWEWKGAAQDVPVTDDELTSRAGATEPAGARSAEYTLITRAFTSLPERWRTVLWRTAAADAALRHALADRGRGCPACGGGAALRPQSQRHGSPGPSRPAGPARRLPPGALEHPQEQHELPLGPGQARQLHRRRGHPGRSGTHRCPPRQLLGLPLHP